jgi:RHH-type transcriptional regulator, proline utilization regulon repressor / proline dehydrogenase / delta 1-pyrroline-5-carboxylate dehydrogenase
MTALSMAIGHRGSQPFGGSGLSGTGPNCLHRFCLEQVISVNTAASGG